MRFAILVAGLGVLGAGCGPTCQSTCNLLYSDSAVVGMQQLEGCQIQRPGKSQEELISYCMDQCESALERSGDLDGYDPTVRSSSTSSVQLENEAQAAVWMECVVGESCERLEEGYCAPVW